MLKTTLLAVFAATGLMAQAPNIAGKWEGALEAGGAKLRLQVDLSRSSDGLYLGSFTSIDQGGVKIPIDRITATGSAVHFELKMVNGVYDGSLDAGGNKMAGTWTQGGPNMPLEFTRIGKGPAAHAHAIPRRPAFPIRTAVRSRSPHPAGSLHGGQQDTPRL